METNQLSDAEIMKTLLKELRYSANQFSKDLGYSSHSTIYHIQNGRNQISDDLVDNIIKHFPQVSYWFLKRGKLPVVLDEKMLIVHQSNLFSAKEKLVAEVNYSLESFAVLKNIENLLQQLLEIEQKKTNS